MNKYFITGTLLVFLTFSVFGQKPVLNISFLENLPVIDGLPDESVTRLEWQSFSYSEKSNDSNTDFTTLYKMAYSLNCLYLLIETESDSIVFRVTCVIFLPMREENSSRKAQTRSGISSARSRSGGT